MSSESNSKKEFSVEDLRKHATPSNAFVAYQDGVFDVTKFFPKHPGGSGILAPYLGQDITEAFDEVGHSQHARDQMLAFRVGTYTGRDEDLENGKSTAAAQSKRWNKKVSVKKCEPLGESDAVELTLTWDATDGTDDDEVDLQVGQHIMLRVQTDGVDVTRPYTPLSFNASTKTLVLAIRLYNIGEMSKAIQDHIVNTSNHDALSVDVEGPYGSVALYNDSIKLLSPGTSSVVESIKCDKYVLIAGGTGITPFLSLLQAKSLKAQKVCLVLLVNEESQVLYLTELKEYVEQNKLDVVVVVTTGTSDSPHNDDVQKDGIRWLTISEPYVNSETLCSALDSLGVRNRIKNSKATTVICGPPPMEKAIREILLSDAIGASEKLVVATTQAGERALLAKREKNKTTNGAGPFPGNQHFWYFAFAMVLPMLAVAMNSGYPFDGGAYWPHEKATGENATGMNGKVEILGFETDCPNNFDSCYVYVLKNPQLVTLVVPWVLYLIHYSAVLYVQYKTFKESPKYSNDFRWFNWAMLGINTTGAIAKYINSSFNYNGLAATLPIGWGVGTIMSYLSVVLLMYIPVRGIFFGYGANFNFVNECAYYLRKYHGFYIGFIVVNDFWFHPFESSPGHLIGILNEALLLWQIVTMYTPGHINRWWCFVIETMVIGHAFLIATLRNGQGTMGYFGFGYVIILAVTQIHGLGLSKAIRGATCGFLLAAMLFWYGVLKPEGVGFEGLPRVFTAVPPLQYGLCIVFVLAFHALKQPLRCISNERLRQVYYLFSSFMMMIVGAGPMLLLFSRLRPAENVSNSTDVNASALIGN